MKKKALYWGKKYLASITPLAKQGNATYELVLGKMYNQGLYGLEKDHKQALYWYHKALATFKPLADQGNPSAQIYLSGMYQVGLGVERNQEIAIQWLRKSAISNNVIAQQKLSIVSLFSLDKNAESYAWYLIAKDNGMLDVKWGSYINSHISDSEKQQGEKLKDKLLKEIKK